MSRSMSISAVPVLPATSTPSSAAAVPVPSLTTFLIIAVSVARRVRVHDALGPLALDLVLRAAVGVDDLLRDVRLHPHAAVGDRRRDRRHLQRRDEQLVLADRHAPDVDLRASVGDSSRPPRRARRWRAAGRTGRSIGGCL